MDVDPRIPIQKLHRANVVVHDLRATARGYAELLGIERWQVVHHTADRLSDTSAHGFAASFTYSTATGSNARGVTFRLIQPTGGFSTFTEFLITRGEGVHSVCTAVLADPPAGAALHGWLASEGIPVGQAATVDGAARHTFFDTRRALGGFFVEVVWPLMPGGEEAVAVDEVWDFGAEFQRPPGVEVAQQIARIGHFGVAVPDLMERLPSYARLLGLQTWSALHFRPAPGSLEYSTLSGHEVQHAFLQALAGHEDVAFELLQGTRGPTDYAAFIERTGGPGIHHLLVLHGLPEDQWLPLRAWLAALDVPVLMSGRVRFGAAEFFYLDTRARLGGWVLEVIVAAGVGAPPAGTDAPPATTTAPPDPLGRFTLDFSRPIDR